MKTTTHVHAFTLALLTSTFAACSAQTLSVGTGADSEQSTISCGPSDCAAYEAACPHGAAMSETCEVDDSPDFLPRSLCTLRVVCAEGTPTCAWKPTTCSGSGPCSAPSGGGGVVSVDVSPATAAGAAATTLDAYFNHAQDSALVTLGACTYDPEGASVLQSGVVGAPAPRPGIVTVTAPGFRESVTPACDGTYATATTKETLTPGALVAFAFTGAAAAGSGDSFPSALPSVPAPHFVTLASTDALAAAAPELTRGADLDVDWTVAGAPLALEQVVVVLTQKTATVTCAFDASAGSGVVPADALLKLSPGAASFAVRSVHEADTDASDGWDLRFLARATAATPTGLAVGSATLK